MLAPACWHFLIESCRASAAAWRNWPRGGRNDKTMLAHRVARSATGSGSFGPVCHSPSFQYIRQQLEAMGTPAWKSNVATAAGQPRQFIAAGVMVAPTSPGFPEGALGMNRLAVWAMGSNVTRSEERRVGKEC